MLTALGYIVAISIGLAIVLGLYVYNVVPKEKDYTTVVGAFYVPFSEKRMCCRTHGTWQSFMWYSIDIFDVNGRKGTVRGLSI